MHSRTELHSLLCEVLGSSNVYFQPPETIKMNYPAIVYFRDNIENSHANDGVYMQDKRYEVIFISKSPDSPIIDELSMLPKCQYNRHYKSDGLNHDVFKFYY